MRLKLLGLMRERNFYLEKCRTIEKFGEEREWQASTPQEQDLFNQLHEILYRQQDYDDELDNDINDN